jgi:hypothetical protein
MLDSLLWLLLLLKMCNILEEGEILIDNTYIDINQFRVMYISFLLIHSTWLYAVIRQFFLYTLNLESR